MTCTYNIICFSAADSQLTSPLKGSEWKLLTILLLWGLLQVLQLDPEVTDEEIKKRFRQVGSSDVAAELIVGITLEQIVVTDFYKEMCLAKAGEMLLA